MSRFIIYPYKLGSQSAKKLADGLDTIRVRPNGRYRYRPGDTIINFGNSEIPDWWTPDAEANTINHPESVALASHKVRTFETLTREEVTTVPWTTDRSEAQEWLNDGHDIFVRHKLQGHSGEGIEIVKGSDEKVEARIHLVSVLENMGYSDMAERVASDITNVSPEAPQAPLYTRKVENHGEYRLHVFKGRIIDYRKKSRLREDEPTPEQSLVRTLGNGWIFRQGDLRRVERIEQLALDACSALGLDFCCVDIIKDENGDIFVLEVNTAVAMEDRTLEVYLDNFRSLIS